MRPGLGMPKCGAFPGWRVNFMENPNLKWMIWGYPVFLGFSHCISRRVATMGTLLRSDNSLHHISARHQPLRRVPQSDRQTAKEKILTEILQGSSHLAGFIKQVTNYYIWNDPGCAWNWAHVGSVGWSSFSTWHKSWKTGILRGILIIPYVQTHPNTISSWLVISHQIFPLYLHLVIVWYLRFIHLRGYASIFRHPKNMTGIPSTTPKDDQCFLRASSPPTTSISLNPIKRLPWHPW